MVWSKRRESRQPTGCWSIGCLRSCSGNRLQLDVNCVVLRHRPANGTFWADVIDEEANASLVFELGNWKSMTAGVVVSGDCVKELEVHLLLTWATVVDFPLTFCSLVFPLWLFAFL